MSGGNGSGEVQWLSGCWRGGGACYRSRLEHLTLKLVLTGKNRMILKEKPLV